MEALSLKYIVLKTFAFENRVWGHQCHWKRHRSIDRILLLTSSIVTSALACTISEIQHYIAATLKLQPRGACRSIVQFIHEVPRCDLYEA